MYPTSANSDNDPALDSELNPLSNPLLAANMGRWAEVYFTNPPERRAQAVADLLQELKTQAGGNSKIGEEAAIMKAHLEPAPAPPQAVGVTEGPGTKCSACGHENLDGQSFCGMCGVRLTSTSEGREAGYDEQLRPASVEQSIHGILGPYFADPAIESQGNADAVVEEPDLPSLPAATGHSALPSFATQAEPAPYRYRLYVGVVLAILLGGLIFLGKRGEVVSDGQQSPDSKVIPAAQPSANTQPPQSTANNPPLPQVEKNENPPQPRPEAEPAPAAVAQNDETPPQPAVRSGQTAAKTPNPSPERAAAENQSGAATLAEAQKYLNGSQGGVRQTREALPLLWDAVAKGNAPATLVLSDLYLRGDGVPQNCDQARLLLDLAAKKGVKGASERLRHLQAFGCQ